MKIFDERVESIYKIGDLVHPASDSSCRVLKNKEYPTIPYNTVGMIGEVLYEDIAVGRKIIRNPHYGVLWFGEPQNPFTDSGVWYCSQYSIGSALELSDDLE